MRTALNKLNDEGIVRPDARGGRHASLREKDSATRSAAHIQLFPRMESHFCRQSTTREYLHPDLTIKKMYYFYVQEGRQPECSYYTYRSVFKSLNLSFHHPKKGQCSLCSSYKEGSTETKAKLEDSFAAHIAEKDSVRKKKKDAKESSQENPEVIASAVFDLQQNVCGFRMLLDRDASFEHQGSSGGRSARRLGNQNYATVYGRVCNRERFRLRREPYRKVSTAIENHQTSSNKLSGRLWISRFGINRCYDGIMAESSGPTVNNAECHSSVE
ncbi:unnamed protein product [Acanthoscelides obtectus]|uniref:Uncharacterized protein n=1 Tax=Acanthoscelides obtectus TaxID=200917 RepID=A0A9P0KGB5_ACAOB|nr:unnamed protein product [Acanthoscelides obtectus]CAK1646976.1 hypothetical protein AOBTE_LOCUS14980 [Acanthoscelides obtectus]